MMAMEEDIAHAVSNVLRDRFRWRRLDAEPLANLTQRLVRMCHESLVADLHYRSRSFSLKPLTKLDRFSPPLRRINDIIVEAGRYI
jgi:hypothetical protein